MQKNTTTLNIPSPLNHLKLNNALRVSDIIMEEEKDLEYSAIDHGDMKNLVYETSSKSD